MIDFRYHLVSLISVFLALAVGIVLGAGPLKEPIGDSLSNQVEALRTDRDGLRSQLNTSNDSIEKLDRYIVDTAPTLLKDSLPGTTITVVTGPESDAEVVKAVRDRLTEAGGTVGATAALASGALNARGAGDFLPSLRKIDAKLPEDNEQALRMALSQALTGKDLNGSVATAAEDTTSEPSASPDSSPAATSPAATSPGSSPAANGKAEANALFKAFVDSGRISVEGDFTPTELIVFLDSPSPPAPATPATASASPVTPKRSTVTDFVDEVAANVAVVAAGDSGSAVNGLISFLRADKSKATTVDGLNLAAGPVIVAMAAKEAAQGSRGDYGFADSAGSLLPEGR